MSSRGLEDGVPASKHGKGGGGGRGGSGGRGSSQSATSSLREGRDRQTANAHWRVSLVEMVRPGFRERDDLKIEGGFDEDFAFRTGRSKIFHSLHIFQL